MKKILVLVSTFFFLFFQTSFAQSNIKGVITDADNAPLAGTAISVRGTALGTTTNNQGAFSLNVPSNAILVISHVGYTTKEVSVEGRTFVSESLTQKENQLQSVIYLCRHAHRAKMCFSIPFYQKL